jgi:hypothetical protein
LANAKQIICARNRSNIVQVAAAQSRRHARRRVLRPLTLGDRVPNSSPPDPNRTVSSAGPPSRSSSSATVTF